jgi:hypothetical protein
LVDGSRQCLDIGQNLNDSYRPESIQNQSNSNQRLGEATEKESPSPASSSVSISSENASSETNPIQTDKLTKDDLKGFQNKYQYNISTSSVYFNNHKNIQQTLTPNRFVPPLSIQSLSNNNTPSHNSGNRFVNQQPNNYSNFYSPQHQFNLNNKAFLVNDLNKLNSNMKNTQQQYKKQLSQSFRDILENTLLINGFDDQLNCSQLNPAMINHVNNSTLKSPIHDFNAKMNSLQQQLLANKITSNNNNRQINSLNKSTSALNNSINNNINLLNMLTPATHNHNIPVQIFNLTSQNYQKSQTHSTSNTNIVNTQVPSSPIEENTKIVIKFAELERTLALTKAENTNLLEQQLHARERELQLLQEEKRKRESLERKLNEEIMLRETIFKENIKLRDKKKTQVIYYLLIFSIFSKILS